MPEEAPVIKALRGGGGITILPGWAWMTTVPEVQALRRAAAARLLRLANLRRRAVSRAEPGPLSGPLRQQSEQDLDLLEQPIRHRPSVPTRANVRLAALCMLVPIVAAFGIALVAIGLVVSEVLFTVGMVLLLVAAIEWTMTAWAASATGDQGQPTVSDE